MRSFDILIDMDDTLESLVPAWVQWLNASHGLNVDPESVTEWDMSIAFPTLTKEEIFTPLSLREFWKTVMPKPDAAEYVKRLIDDGHHVYICTASHYKGLQDKMELALFRHFPFLKWTNVIVAHNKSMVRGDFIIDDAPHNLMNWNSDVSQPFLMDAPHNRANHESKWIRVHTWKEVYERISKITQRYDEAYEQLASAPIYREEVAQV